MKKEDKLVSAVRYLNETRQLLHGKSGTSESLSDRIKHRRATPLADWFSQLGSMGANDQKKNR